MFQKNSGYNLDKPQQNLCLWGAQLGKFAKAQGESAYIYSDKGEGSL